MGDGRGNSSATSIQARKKMKLRRCKYNSNRRHQGFPFTCGTTIKWNLKNDEYALHDSAERSDDKQFDAGRDDPCAGDYYYGAADFLLLDDDATRHKQRGSWGIHYGAPQTQNSTACLQKQRRR